MTARKYETLSEQRLLSTLANARDKIAHIKNEKKALDKRLNSWLLKEAQIKKALDERYVPNDETIRAMKESKQNGANGDIIEVEELAQYLRKLADE